MVRRNEDTIRRTFETVNSDGLAGVLALVEDTVHPECEWLPALSGVEGRVYRGRAGMRDFWRDWFGAFEDIRYEGIQVRSVETDRVILLCQVILRGRGSAIPLRQDLGVLYEFDAGLIRRGAAYFSHDDALKAASRASKDQTARSRSPE